MWVIKNTYSGDYFGVFTKESTGGLYRDNRFPAGMTWVSKNKKDAYVFDNLKFARAYVEYIRSKFSLAPEYIKLFRV